MCVCDVCVCLSSDGYVTSDQSGSRTGGGHHDIVMPGNDIPVVTIARDIIGSIGVSDVSLNECCWYTFNDYKCWFMTDVVVVVVINS